jgi:hypothetical protein
MVQLIEENVALLDEQQRFELFEAQCPRCFRFGGGLFWVAGGGAVDGGAVFAVGPCVAGVGLDGAL